MNIFKLILFVGILLKVTPRPARTQLDTSVHEMFITVMTCADVNLTLSNDVKTNLTVNFIEHNPGIATVNNTTVEFQPVEGDQWKTITVCGHTRGRCLIDTTTNPSIAKNTAFIQVAVHAYAFLRVVSHICGWTYFVLWSSTFYAQMRVNTIRQSVIGYNFDFVLLHALGFLYYSIFNCSLYWIKIVQDQYFKRRPRSVNPVQLNDVFFSVHAFVLTVATGVQCAVYESGDQHVSKIMISAVIITTLGLIFCINLVWLNYMEILSLLYWFANIKLVGTMVKYLPQIYMNYRMKSASGWSMANVIIDIFGGIFSILQMFIISYNYDDWVSVIGDFTKFGIGVFSIILDSTLFIQHYVLYPESKNSQ